MSSSAVSVGGNIVNNNDSDQFNMLGSNPKNTVNEKKKTPEKSQIKTLYDYFKLKEAVVVLNDISKSKYYQNLVASAKLLDKTPQNEKMYCVKMETEFYGPESSASEIQRENIKIVDTCSLVNTSRGEGVGNNEKGNYEVFGVNITLTALAEGCNFSEILKRFKLKQSVGFVDLRNSLESVTQTEIYIKEEEIINNDSDIEEPYNVSAVTENLNDGEDCTDEFRSWSMDTEPIKLESAIKETNQEEEFTQILDFDNQFKSNERSHLNLSSDSDNGNDVTAEVESSLSHQRVAETKIYYLSDTTNSPFLLPINRFTFHKNNLVDSVQFNLKQEKMKSHNKSNTERETLKYKLPASKSPSSEASSLPKRMKRLKEEEEKSQKKKQPSSGLEEYIPLQAYGPTKFAVALLNKVTPYKTHEAKNFKSKMLFGNRVTRFSNSNVLKTFTMKRNAYKNQAS